MSKTTFSHLSLSERIQIEQMLSVGRSVTEIAGSIGYSRQAVTQEIRRSAISSGYAKAYGRHWNGCVHQRMCELRKVCGFRSECNKRCKSCRNYNCIKYCTEFCRDTCLSLICAPHVCNGCSRYATCVHERMRYSAEVAHSRARSILVESRSGSDLTSDELALISKTVAPLLRAGQAPSLIWKTCADRIPCSERSLYRLIHAGALDGISTLNLPYAVRYRPRAQDKAERKTNIAADVLVGRTHTDFLALDEYLRDHAIEGDCVCGPKGEAKAILTLLWRDTQFQLMLLIDSQDTQQIRERLDYLESLLEQDFPPIILIDRGSEFCDAESMEASIFGEGKRSRVYYCDPQRPDQKAKCENNHRFIRRILPKKTSFEGLTAYDMADLMSHINSVPRKSLGGKSPMSLAKRHLPKRLFDELGIREIPYEEIVLKPHLLR